jgi:Type II secretion system (T2SS), protein E, N-terminal domain
MWLITEGKTMAHEKIVSELTAILLKNKMVSEKEAHALQRVFQESSRDNFCDFLLEEGLVEEEDLLHALSQYYKVPSFDVHGYFFEHFLVHRFPKEFMLLNGFIPLEVDEDSLVVVAADPEVPGLESAMRNFVSYDIIFFVGLRRDIIDAVEEFYDKPPQEDNEEPTLDEQMREEKETVQEDGDRKELSYGDIVYRDDEDKWRD